MDNFIVTIGRQMGSGGREIGRKLAELLGVDFYDKRLLTDAAKKSGLLPEILERDDERSPSLFGGAMLSYSLLGIGQMSGYIGDDSVYRAQSDMIRELGATKSCVIVGRTADYVLREHPRCINIFIHAPEDQCVRRLLSRGERASESEARALVRKINKLRAGYYNFYTDRAWGAATTYDLTVNSAMMSTDDLAALLAAYVRLRLSL